ncbi:MAG: putative effector of murein hydrolase [Herbinix sp.]|jgi:predicted murein hydrolase (TIGR00659 family)|nr:putative effector of murein hydrolase [Herbinix sp.]
MRDFLLNATYFGVALSLIGYVFGLLLHKKFKLALFNPLLISIAFVIVFLLIFKIDYSDYNVSAKYLSYLLTPATICLAIPMYERFQLFKDNWKAIISGIIAGVLGSATSILILSVLFRLDHELYVTLLPKSITSALAMGVSEELGGNITVTVSAVILTGILGNMFAVLICKIGKINEPVAKGIAIGSSSHAIGTAKAMEIGETEGAMSSLAIVVSGVTTVAAAILFSYIY